MLQNGKLASEIPPSTETGLGPSLLPLYYWWALLATCFSEELPYKTPDIWQEKASSRIIISFAYACTWLRYPNNRVCQADTTKAWFSIPSLLITNICDFHKWITTVDQKEFAKREYKNAKLHEITELNNKKQSYHRASLCSISLRKPLWNLCKGSKLEKMRFFSVSGMQSSLLTVFWNHYKEKKKQNYWGVECSRYDDLLSLYTQPKCT